MRYSPKGFLALRVWVIVGFILAWNGVLLVAIMHNGGFGRIVDPTARRITAAVMGVTSVLAAAIMLSPRVRRAVTAPARRDWYDPAPYWAVALVCGFLAVVVGFDLAR